MIWGYTGVNLVLLIIGGIIIGGITGLIGGIVGLPASTGVRNRSYDILVDILLGVVGSVIGGVLAALLYPPSYSTFIVFFITAFICGCGLLVVRHGLIITRVRRNISLVQHTSNEPQKAPAPEEKVSLSQQQRLQNASPSKDLSQPTPSIFVSHSSKDDDFGLKLVQDLRKAFRDEEAIWYDSEGGLYGGDPWWSRIVSTLQECDIFVIVLSPNSVRSKWVMRELDIAMVEGKRIIPVLYHQCDIRPDLRAIQFISFLEPTSYEAAFDRLLQAIRH